MIARVLAPAVGLCLGLAASQLPEFGQQYRQRLGGAIDELQRVVTRFDAGAGAAGLKRGEALDRLEASPDRLVRDQAAAQTAAADRLAALERQRRAFAESGPFARLLVLIRQPDPLLMRATYLDYEPAWPATPEGVVGGGAGFLAGWLAILFGSRLVRRLVSARRRAPGLRSV